MTDVTLLDRIEILERDVKYLSREVRKLKEKPPRVKPFSAPVLLAVWTQLSRQCQADLRHTRPGSIIHCTEEDMRLMKQFSLDGGRIEELMDVQLSDG